ncbi:MAG TPA: alpha/beta hydrolase [Candidatus Binatia bacterium]|nr:alpha/beta hydrolase [Candidatus Binatia bacterium]
MLKPRCGRKPSGLRNSSSSRTGLARWFFALLLFGLPLAEAQPTCVGVGDCDHGGVVTVEELVKGVNIALGNATVDQCSAFDCHGDGHVTVDCLVQGVHGALEGVTVGVNGTERIDVGGHKLNIKCIGSGEPTIVLDAGRGDNLDIWFAVQPGIAGFTRVCAYDRAGYGKSDPGPLPRTSAQIVSELHALLTNSCLPGPYLFVGHSLGGLNIQLYARTYPQEVAGLVFVDGRPPGFYDGLNAFDPPLPPEIYKLYVSCDDGTSPTSSAGSECRSIATSESEVDAAGPLPDVPAVVFVAGQADAGLPPVTAQQMSDLWLQLQMDLLHMLPHGTLNVVAECKHYIHLCRPDVINGAVRNMVEGLRTNR